MRGIKLDLSSERASCRENDQNRGIAIATNSGLKDKRHVVAFDYDDMVAPHAFKVILKAIRETTDTDFIYMPMNSSLTTGLSRFR